MARRVWWQRPTLRTDEDEDRERRVTWLELFFDLYFVVVITELAHYLSVHTSWSRVGGFILLFLPVWWIWIGATYYLERFETEGVENRLFIFLQMIPIAGLAISITAAGVGTQKLISDEDWILQRDNGFLIAGAIEAALIMMGLLELCLRREPDEPTHPTLSPALKLGAGAIAIILGWLSNGMYALILQCLLMGLLAVQMGYGLYMWFTQELQLDT